VHCRGARHGQGNATSILTTLAGRPARTERQGRGAALPGNAVLGSTGPRQLTPSRHRCTACTSRDGVSPAAACDSSSAALCGRGQTAAGSPGWRQPKAFSWQHAASSGSCRIVGGDGQVWYGRLAVVRGGNSRGHLNKRQSSRKGLSTGPAPAAPAAPAAHLCVPHLPNELQSTRGVAPQVPTALHVQRGLHSRRGCTWHSTGRGSDGWGCLAEGAPNPCWPSFGTRVAPPGRQAGRRAGGRASPHLSVAVATRQVARDGVGGHGALPQQVLNHRRRLADRVDRRAACPAVLVHQPRPHLLHLEALVAHHLAAGKLQAGGQTGRQAGRQGRQAGTQPASALHRSCHCTTAARAAPDQPRLWRAHGFIVAGLGAPHRPANPLEAFFGAVHPQPELREVSEPARQTRRSNWNWCNLMLMRSATSNLFHATLPQHLST
jgi:hypothetical protein